MDNRRQSGRDSKYKDERKSEREYSDRDKFRRTSDDSKYKHGRTSPKYQEAKKDDKYKDRRSRERDDRSKDYKKDRNRDDKSRYRDDRGRDSRRNKEDQDRYRDSKDDRRSYRGSSRERHRSRSPRRSDYGKRSSSRERNRSGYSKRYERATNKMDRLEKLGIELGASGSDAAGTSGEMYNNKDEQEKNRFFMPGITGRFTEQIQRRKLLWQKKDTKTEVVPTAPQGQKVWQNTTFAQDNDGKVANKFKRLMGIREQGLGMPPKSTNDNLKKQEEMFTSMEAQYEVARTATHTMRGVGLGFGSFQR